MDRSPHKSGFVSVGGGIRLHYLDWGGDGPALVFLPGLGCNAHIFDSFAPRFTDRFHVLGLTRRGHGDSDYPETGYDIDTLTEDIRQFLDHMGIERVILAGHSLAGIELSHFSALYPHRVIKLVFLDAAYDRSSAEFKTMLEKNPINGVQIPGANDDYYSVAAYADFIKRTYPSLAAIWSELMEEHFAHEVKTTPEGRVVDKMTETISKAIHETVAGYVPEDAQIRAPALSIYTLKDNRYYVSPSYMTEEQQAQQMEFFDLYVRPANRHSIEKFRRDVPHARVVELPGGHHYCFIQQSELVYNEMRAFLLGEDSRRLEQ